MCQIVLIYSVSQKNLPHPLMFSELFPQWLTILKQNFTHLLYVYIYAKLQNFIRVICNSAHV